MRSMPFSRNLNPRFAWPDFPAVSGRVGSVARTGVRQAAARSLGRNQTAPSRIHRSTHHAPQYCLVVAFPANQFIRRADLLRINLAQNLFQFE